MSSTHDTATHAQSQKAVQRHASNPYATLGQLSYAPATQTTVVTTTTTTTTSFPPIILKAPRHLNDRDPKLYPLASSPTPNSIRQLQFDVGGQLAYFDEAGDVDRSLREVCSLFIGMPCNTSSDTYPGSRGTRRSLVLC